MPDRRVSQQRVKLHFMQNQVKLELSNLLELGVPYFLRCYEVLKNIHLMHISVIKNIIKP